MASRRTEETGLLPGPWDADRAENHVPWGVTGYEETTPLLISDPEDFAPEEPTRVQAGPWAARSSNPFDEDWVPLYEPLLTQEKFIPKLVDISIPLPKLINEEKFGLKTSSVLFGSGEAKINGPSHPLYELLILKSRTPEQQSIEISNSVLGPSKRVHLYTSLQAQ